MASKSANFQLPLSGSRYGTLLVRNVITPRSLSTPSLGITREGRWRAPREDLPQSRFQLPLSGSQNCSPCVPLCDVLVRIFQLPLSGSHGLYCGQEARRACGGFQLPLSGSLGDAWNNFVGWIADNLLSTPSLGITSYLIPSWRVAYKKFLSTPSLGITTRMAIL